MLAVKAISFGFGSIEYQKEIEGRPKTTKTTRQNGVEVSVIDQAIHPVPAHYRASFSLNVTFEQDGHEISNYALWNCIVPEEDRNAPYSSIELRAAQQIAPMLRSFADRIEADLAPPPQKTVTDN